MEFRSMEVDYLVVLSSDKTKKHFLNLSTQQLCPNDPKTYIRHYYAAPRANEKRLCGLYPYQMSVGTIIKTKDNILHCLEGPAIINEKDDEFANKYGQWWKDGHSTSPEEIFVNLSPEQQEQVLWNLHLWK